MREGQFDVSQPSVLAALARFVRHGLVSIEPGGKIARTALRRLLNAKDEAQYGIMHVSGAELKTTIRQARQLLTFAERGFQI